MRRSSRDGRDPYRSVHRVTVAGRSAALGEPGYGGPAAAGVLRSTASGRGPGHDKLGSHAHLTKGPRTSSHATGPAEKMWFTERTRDELTSDFGAASCRYSGSCPSFPDSGNGLLYSYAPSTTAIPPTVLAEISQQGQTQAGDNGSPVDGDHKKTLWAGMLGSGGNQPEGLIFVDASLLPTIGTSENDSHPWWDAVVK